MIFRCQPGFEALLERELGREGWRESARGEGWVRAEGGAREAMPEGGWCFAQQMLIDPVEVTAESVNALAGRVLEVFLDSAKAERFEGAWPCVFAAAAGLEGLGRRVDGVEKAFAEVLKKRMGRVARLATAEVPWVVGETRGLWVFFTDFRRAWVARRVWLGGQRRMADDPLAPSRSYLKVEEAYGVLGYEPAVGETVVDLGAAPGGWSYSAAKRGARVVAVDNGPLKGGALGHAGIGHLREDAFRYRPAGETVDWMFCDLVEEPHHVLENLIAPWLEGRWCRRFVVMLKFGRVDPVALLAEVRRVDGLFARCAPGFRVRQLYHDREEFTIVGEVRG